MGSVLLEGMDVMQDALMAEEWAVEWHWGLMAEAFSELTYGQNGEWFLRDAVDRTNGDE